MKDHLTETKQKSHRKLNKDDIIKIKDYKTIRDLSKNFNGEQGKELVLDKKMEGLL